MIESSTETKKRKADEIDTDQKTKQKETIDYRPTKKHRHNDEIPLFHDGIATINAGGKKIMTSLSTLTGPAAGPVLSRMFSEENRSILKFLDDGSVWIDTDPNIFKFIIQCIRRECVPSIDSPPSAIDPHVWERELLFWQFTVPSQLPIVAEENNRETETDTKTVPSCFHVSNLNKKKDLLREEAWELLSTGANIDRLLAKGFTYIEMLVPLNDLDNTIPGKTMKSGESLCNFIVRDADGMVKFIAKKINSAYVSVRVLEKTSLKEAAYYSWHDKIYDTYNHKTFAVYFTLEEKKDGW